MDGFEWDEDKRRRNLADHGVDFRLAARMFQETVLEAADQRGGYDEPRYRALGSAWKVGPDGRRRYQTLLGRAARAHGRAR